jgi:hypothetical protein
VAAHQNNRRGKVYSLVEIRSALSTLHANRGNTSLTARQLGVPRATLIGWAKAAVKGLPLPGEYVLPRRSETLSDDHFKKELLNRSKEFLDGFFAGYKTGFSLASRPPEREILALFFDSLALDVLDPASDSLSS